MDRSADHLPQPWIGTKQCDLAPEEEAGRPEVFASEDEASRLQVLAPEDEAGWPKVLTLRGVHANEMLDVGMGKKERQKSLLTTHRT